MDCTIPVVVLGARHHGALGIVRSLGRLRVPVYSVDAEPWAPAFASRYCRGKLVLDFENGSGEQAVSRLLAFGRKLGGRPVLITTTDTGTIWAAHHAEALRETFRFPGQGEGLVRSLCDKSRMQQLASRVGVDIAGSFVPRCREDVLSFLDTATFPVMLKAIDDAKLRRNLGATKFVIRSRQQLLALYDRVDDGGSPSLMLQEYIPGEDWMFNGYFNEQSDCLMGITGKKIRRFPVSTGVTSLGICLRNEVVEETTRRFMKAIGYRGILDIGYRYDYRNGQYRVLDVNPRIGCTFRLFVTSNGLDVARCLYLDLTGQPVTAAPATEGRKWMVEDFDIISALCCWRGGELTLANWVRSMAGVREAAFFALEDPLPLLPAGVSDIRELYRWLRRRRGARRNGKSPEPQADLVKTEAVRTEESGSLAKTR